MIQRYLLHSLVMLLSLCCADPVDAREPETLLRLGDSAYVSRKYDSAVHYYKQAISRVNPDPLALYKLGNAHYRLNQVAEAVLAYERALKHRPGFAAAAENLELIQGRLQPERARNEVFFIRWWRNLTRPSLSNAWAMLGVISFCIPLGVLIWSRVRRKWPTWLWPQTIVWGVALSLLFAVLAAASVPDSPRNSAVVMKAAAFHLQSKPGDKSPALNVPEGLVVQVAGTDGDRLLVTLPDGRTGHMQASDIALVE